MHLEQLHGSERRTLVTSERGNGATTWEQAAMNTKLVAVVLVVALVATGVGTGLAVLLSR